MKTIKAILEQGEWLTAEQLNALQPSPSTQKSQPASEWKRLGRIFAVSHGGEEYFARYQFDEAYQPLPVIEEFLRAFGEVADIGRSPPGSTIRMAGSASLAPKGRHLWHRRMHLTSVQPCCVPQLRTEEVTRHDSRPADLGPAAWLPPQSGSSGGVRIRLLFGQSRRWSFE